MSSKNYEYIPLKWDSDYFRISCARVNLFGILDKKDKEEILKLNENFEFITIANTNNINENNRWLGIETNAFLVDMNIQFLKIMDYKPDNQDSSTSIVNNYPRSEQILEIAKESFDHSRFFNDPKLPIEKALNIYHKWTENAFDKENKFFVIRERQGIIAGYILFSMEKDLSVIELIAVNKKFQRQNTGKILIQTMESFVLERGITKIKVGTQVNNISAMQFYSKVGFTPVSCGSVYHLWNQKR